MLHGDHEVDVLVAAHEHLADSLREVVLLTRKRQVAERRTWAESQADAKRSWKLFAGACQCCVG